MLPYLAIIWLYVSGGSALYALADPWERHRAGFVFSIIGWPVSVPAVFIYGCFIGAFRAAREVIGK